MLKYSILWFNKLNKYIKCWICYKGTYMWVHKGKIKLTSKKYLKHKGNILKVSLLKQMKGIQRDLSSEEL